MADSQAQDSNDNKTNRQNPDLGPMEGGQWRPVRPEELLRKNQAVVPDEPITPKPKVTLERRQELEQHIKASPTDRDAYLELAAIYRSEDRPMDAKRTLQHGAQIFPSDEKLLWELEEATLARSLQQLREVSELANRLRTSEANRELKRSQNDWACRRIDVCRARLQRDPTKSQLRVAIGEAMYDAEMYDEALHELTAAVKDDEFAPQAYLIRGRCLLAKGKDLDAMAAFRAASMRRAVPAPLKIKLAGLKLLCETAERLGIHLTLERYRQQLHQVEQDMQKNARLDNSVSQA